MPLLVRYRCQKGLTVAEPDELDVRCSMPSRGSEFFVKCGALNGFSAKTVNPTFFRNYINGFKRPSAARLQQIQEALKTLAET